LIISGRIQGFFRGEPLRVTRARHTKTPPSGGVRVSGPGGTVYAHKFESQKRENTDLSRIAAEAGKRADGEIDQNMILNTYGTGYIIWL
jgi:hypothetical protein